MIYPNPQIYPHLKTIFVHVPKAAGTSIEATLRETKDVVVGGHTTALGFKRKYPDLFHDYYKFTVVRHPLDRFISAFHYLLKQPVHAALRNDLVHECGSLGRFTSHVAENPGTISRIVHLLPQHQFICDRNDAVLVDAVFKFENLGEAWVEICRRTGLPHAPLARLNPSPRKQSAEAGTEELAAIVAKLYARDFELFGYT